MSIYLALLLSIGLHAALILGPAWLALHPRPVAQARIEARLVPPDELADQVEAVTTNQPAPAHPVEPSQLRGESLRRAQVALTRHLFYPPQAVAQGLEGEVILLLTLSDSGALTAVDIARSSGHALLDQAALDAAQRIGRLPGTQRQMLFPVRFRLQ